VQLLNFHPKKKKKTRRKNLNIWFNGMELNFNFHPPKKKRKPQYLVQSEMELNFHPGKKKPNIWFK
jgi:hypothetical protein